MNRRIKTGCGCVMGLVCSVTLEVHAALVSEPFAYGAGPLYTVSSNMWATQGNSNDVVTVVDGNLACVGLAPAAGRMVSYGGTGDAAVVKLGPLPGSIYTNGSLFYSLLLNVATTNGMTSSGSAGQNNYLAGLHKNAGNTGTAFLMVKASTNSLRYQVGSGYASSGVTPVWVPTLLQTGETAFVVMQYEFIEGASNDIVRLWLNPESSTLGATSAPPPSVTLTNTGVADISPLSVFQLDQKSTVPASLFVDEVRVGLEWVDVTPPDPELAKMTGRTLIIVR